VIRGFHANNRNSFRFADHTRSDPGKQRWRLPDEAARKHCPQSKNFRQNWDRAAGLSGRSASAWPTNRFDQARCTLQQRRIGVSSSPMPRRNILELLKGGDRRSIGRADAVAAAVSKNLALFPELMKGWRSEDPLVRMRAADATEKITRNNPHWLRPYRRELLGLMAEAKQQELRWHVAAMVPRLPLDSKERRLVSSLLRSYLEDRSSIVRTSALQALADLAGGHPSIRPGVIELLRQSARNGTPAMKARSRKLLLHLERV